MRTSVRLEFVFCLLLALWFLPLAAQQPQHEQTNAGTDFWVTDVVASYDVASQVDQGNFEEYEEHFHSYFVEHLYEPDDYADTAYILIVGNTPCGGYAENPNTGWHYDFSVEPDHITEIKVPEEEVMCYFTQEPQPKGIYIHTECTVYAYLVTRRPVQWNYLTSVHKTTPQKFQILPIQTGLEDCSLPYTVGLSRNESTTIADCCSIIDNDNSVQDNALSESYLIVAHEDNTEIFVAGHYEAESFMSVDTRPEDIVWIPESEYTLHRGEVLVVPMISSEEGPIFLMDTPYDIGVDIHTNCKKVSIFHHRTYKRRALYGGFNCPFLLETVSPFHPGLFGNDYLTLYDPHNMKQGYLRSLHCGDFEDAPFCSHNVVSLYNQSNILNTYVEGEYCHCLPFSYMLPTPFEEFFGCPQFIYNNNPLIAGEIAVYLSCPHSNIFYMTSPITQLPYADKQVKEVFFPIEPYNYEFPGSSLTLFISTTPEGRFTTYVNDELLPDSLFIVDDSLLERYYITKVVLQENIPSILKIENANGFSAYVSEIRTYSQPYTTGRILATCSFYNSGCTYELPSIRPNIGVGVTTFCANDTLRVYAEGNCENYPITWTIEDSTFTSIDNDTLLFPLAFVDTLHFTMIVEKYCPDTLIDTMYVVLHPHITLPADTVICRGASITAQSDMFGFWQWSDGTASATFTPQEEGDYTVTVVNDCGSDSATIHVRFYDDPLYVDFGNDTLLCELATLLLDATQQHPASYLWQDASTNTTYTVISDGRYWVVVTDGCASTSDTIDVTYLYDLRIDLGRDTTICSDRPYQLDVTTPFSHYLWHDGTTAPTHWVDVPGTYSVHVYNVCTEADASVTVEVEECEEAVHVPNAFTPDGDGQNEVFLPVFNHPERVESYSLQVYDRWGRQLFGTENLHQGWDGRGCPTGTYVWRMEYKAAGEKPQLLTGSVTVVR